MQKDRWKEITRIFHAALDLPPEDRPGFVSTAASGDPDLQSEVERLLLADQQAESYLDAPLIPPGAFAAALSDEPQLHPGDILCQRFHILRAVGSGGMGQVFEAHDSELAVNVALKLIRPEIAANPQALARFRQEVRLARRITHPNVCRTFDLDRDTITTPDGSSRTLLFLTMEFLPGETLAARLKRTGRLSHDETLIISSQLAAALDAAHALGIVHRDIKPGNIMLVPTGENSRQPARVVITDFGLARLAPVFSQDEHSITQHSSHSAHPIGTLAYMAPEQMDGRPISGATDIYAFGLLLFEMATGQRAFPSSNLLSGIAQRLTGPPPSPTSLQSGLPESLEQAVQGCLHLKPEDRFQSAQAVLECLTGQSQSPPPPAIPAGKPGIHARRTNWISRNTLLAAAAILLFAVSLFLLGLRYHWWEGNARLDPGALVYLAPVTNQTGDKSLDNITELLEASLEQSAQINLLDQGRAGDIMERMTLPPDTPITQPIGRHIALRANAARVIFAQVTGSQGRYTLNIDIQRPDYNPLRFRAHWPNTFTWQITGNSNSGPSGTIPPELTSTLQTAAEWIRQEVGESQNDIGRLDAPPEDATTGSWTALQELNRAIQLQHQLRTQEAIQHLKHAVAIDPNFALAYGRLGDLEFSNGSSQDGLRYYAKALDLTELERLTTRERDRIRGLAASDSGDLQTAEDAFREYTVNYPQDNLGWFYLGYTLIWLGRSDDGLADLWHSYQLNSSSPAIAAQLGMFEAALGHYQQAAEVANHLPLNGTAAFGAYILGLSAFLQGDYNSAEKHFADSRTTGTSYNPALGTALLAHLDAEKGKFSQAAELLSQGILEDLQAGSKVGESSKLLDRAAMEQKLDSLPAMLTDIEAALRIEMDPSSVDNAAFLLGKSLQESPAPAVASIRKELIQLEGNYPGDELGNYSKIARFHLHAETLLATGQWEAALAEARKAETLEPPIRDRAHWAFILLSVASQAPDPKRKANLRQEAYTAYRQTLLRPGLAWKINFGAPAGFLADEMTEFTKLSSNLGPRDNSILAIRTKLSQLRPSTAPFDAVAATHSK